MKKHKLLFLAFSAISCVHSRLAINNNSQQIAERYHAPSINKFIDGRKNSSRAGGGLLDSNKSKPNEKEAKTLKDNKQKNIKSKRKNLDKKEKKTNKKEKKISSHKEIGKKELKSLTSDSALNRSVIEIQRGNVYLQQVVNTENSLDKINQQIDAIKSNGKALYDAELSNKKKHQKTLKKLTKLEAKSKLTSEQFAEKALAENSLKFLTTYEEGLKKKEGTKKKFEKILAVHQKNDKTVRANLKKLLKKVENESSKQAITEFLQINSDTKKKLKKITEDQKVAEGKAKKQAQDKKLAARKQKKDVNKVKRQEALRGKVGQQNAERLEASAQEIQKKMSEISKSQNKEVQDMLTKINKDPKFKGNPEAKNKQINQNRRNIKAKYDKEREKVRADYNAVKASYGVPAQADQNVSVRPVKPNSKTVPAKTLSKVPSGVKNQGVNQKKTTINKKKIPAAKTTGSNPSNNAGGKKNKAKAAPAKRS